MHAADSSEILFFCEFLVSIGRIEKEMSDGIDGNAAATFSPQHLAQLVDAIWDKHVRRTDYICYRNARAPRNKGTGTSK